MTLLYFGIKTISKELVIPDWAVLPLQLDLSLHVFPTGLQLIDVLWLSTSWEVSSRRASTTSAVLAGMYWLWIERCKEVHGFYPYPIFEQAGLLGRVGLFGLSAVIMTGNTAGLRWVHGLLHGSVKGNPRRKDG